jgi:hypothetical protein
MKRFFADQKDNYCLCFDSVTLKWIIGEKNSR